MAFLADLESADVDLFLRQQGVDTTTPGGKALFQMMGVFAEFERSMIRERVQSGIERARQEEADPQGVRRRRRAGKQAHGRPSVLSPQLILDINQARQKGLSYRSIAKQAGVSLGTVQNALK